MGKVVKILSTVTFILICLSAISLPIGCIFNLSIIILPLSILGVFVFSSLYTVLTDIIENEEFNTIRTN